MGKVPSPGQQYQDATPNCCAMSTIARANHPPSTTRVRIRSTTGCRSAAPLDPHGQPRVRQVQHRAALAAPTDARVCGAAPKHAWQGTIRMQNC